MIIKPYKKYKFSDLEQLNCKCGCGYRGDPIAMMQLIKAIQEILRSFSADSYDDWSVFFKVHSGWRCPEHNKKVGGGKNSQHLIAALDGDFTDYPGIIKFKDDMGSITLSDKRLAIPTLFFDGGGIGSYSWGYHLDPRERKTRW